MMPLEKPFQMSLLLNSLSVSLFIFILWLFESLGGFITQLGSTTSPIINTSSLMLFICFQVLFLETYPNPRFVRRGRASHRKKDLDDEVPSDWEEIASDVENTTELREWLTTTNCKTTLLPKQELVRKYLPPGTVMDLYEHYRSTQIMLGCHCVSFLGLTFRTDLSECNENGNLVLPSEQCFWNVMIVVCFNLIGTTSLQTLVPKVSQHPVSELKVYDFQ